MNLEQRRINFESIVKVEALLAFAEKTADADEIVRLKARQAELVADI